MDQSARDRVALNEATFRRVNEGIRSGDAPEARISIVCECGRLGCNQLVALSREEYEAARRDSRQFIVVPGHQIEEAEDVVGGTDRYVVVRKHPDVGGIVDRTDPRRGPVDP